MEEMVELENFLYYCDAQYQQASPCQCGQACTNNNYCRGAFTNCYACIKRVHNYNNNTTHYNCDKMIYCYALKHGYRFAAEIFYLFQRVQREIAQWDEIHIASIGCGPCTELFGALYHWRSLGKQDSHFHFRGFDLENLWRPIVSQIPLFFPGMDVHADIEDTFQHYHNQPEHVDVIVLNYMLSDMLKFHSGEYYNFLLTLCAMIRQVQPRYILVNDVYLKVSTIATERLLNCLTDQVLNYEFCKMQYHGLNTYIGQFGRSIARQPYSMPNQTIVDRYDPFRNVDSIQTIIRLR